jgi:integrase
MARIKAQPNRRRLNNFLLNNLKPQSSPYLVWDTKQAGLAVQVRPKTGRRTYYCIYSYHNRPRWHRIAAVNAIGLTEARKLAGRVMFRVAEGNDPQAERRASRSAGTFQDLADRYRKYSEKKNKSWKQADWLIRRYLLPKWNKLRAADISRSDIKTLFSEIAAPILANQVLATASAIFEWAIKDEVGGVKVNPCHGVERNPTKKRERVLSDTELPKFWPAFETAGLIESMALKTILLTGQRPGEVAHMRTEHIDGGWWTLPGAPDAQTGWPGTKNAQTHRVWLAKPVQDIIAELEPTGFVFAGPRGNAIRQLDDAMRTICGDLGAPRATPHDLRRTAGTMIAALGFGRDAMNRIQNHREGGIADVYDQHQYAVENKKILDAVASRIMTLASDKHRARKLRVA